MKHPCDTALLACTHGGRAGVDGGRRRPRCRGGVPPRRSGVAPRGAARPRDARRAGGARRATRSPPSSSPRSSRRTPTRRRASPTCAPTWSACAGMLSSLAEERGLGVVGAGSVPLVDASADGITDVAALRADARRVPDARLRAADLRHPGARRRPRPRRRGRGDAALGARGCRRCSRCRPRAPVLEERGHRLRQLAHARLAPLAHRGPARPAARRRRLRRPHRRPRARPGRCPTPGWSTSTCAPRRTRRRSSCGSATPPPTVDGVVLIAGLARALVVHGVRAHDAGPPAAAVPARAAARGVLARRPLRAGGRPRRRHRPRARAAVARGAPAARPPARGPRGRGRLGRRLRARPGGARPRLERGPPAPARQPRRRHGGRRRHARRRDPRRAGARARAARPPRAVAPVHARRLPPAVLRRGRRHRRPRPPAPTRGSCRTWSASARRACSPTRRAATPSSGRARCSSPSPTSPSASSRSTSSRG